MNKAFKLFGNLAKSEVQEDGSVIVSGYASSEEVDSDGEIITADAMRAALPDYMKFANIREMHGASAAGIALTAEVQEDGRTFLEAHIIDDNAAKKVKKQVYKGFSIGGKVTKRCKDDPKKILGISLCEISLVDRPANPKALFEMWKGEGIEGETDDAAEIAAEDPQITVEGGQETIPGAQDELDLGTDTIAGAEAQAEAPANKGMGTIAWLATIIKDLVYLQQNQTNEANREGDGSAIPDALNANITALIQTFQGMVAEESAEQEEAMAADEMADPTAICLAATADDIEKKGSRHNKTDSGLIQAIHDAALALGAIAANPSGDEDTDDSSSDSSKMEKMLGEKDDELVKVRKENSDLLVKNESLEKRVKELEAMPKPAKAILKVVDKSGDDEKAATKAAEVEPAKDDVLGQIKKTLAAGPTLKVGA